MGLLIRKLILRGRDYFRYGIRALFEGNKRKPMAKIYANYKPGEKTTAVGQQPPGTASPGGKPRLFFVWGKIAKNFE